MGSKWLPDFSVFSKLKLTFGFWSKMAKLDLIYRVKTFFHFFQNCQKKSKNKKHREEKTDF
mgnify:CR=1 FL=1